MSQVGGIDVEIKKQSSVCKQMRFSIGRTSLLSTLSRVSGVVERRNAIDILACINIKAQHGSIKLMATDLDISIFASLAADVSTEGEVKVSAHTLHDIVKKLPADLDVNFEDARDNIRSAIGVPSNKEIVFTSGATEANSLVMKGIAGFQHVISAVEHPSILNSACNPHIIPVNQGALASLVAFSITGAAPVPVPPLSLP
ncbi:Uncharacterized protein BM_BM17117 [Brugia malayi]|uniref:DNA polymerase III beta sliding clamp N-terminal domain-containing protein n=1 Tax=Brugia malayi TaxID=6279 RepID=A0A4E9G397_BRUMA|nr:Uncharacterized protein BM_BM17117 [Brugia malayi]VIO99948.1 Uncharacterized protein BM_BM17117 [Brugia malayi]